MLDETPIRRKIRPAPEKPGLWAEGSQKPRFDIRAFAWASLYLTREGLAPVFGAMASATGAFSATVASGAYRLPTARLGRAARIIPSYGRVARWIGGSSDILDHAGKAVMPAGPPAEPPPPEAPQPATRQPETAEPAAPPLPEAPAAIVPVRPRVRRAYDTLDPNATAAADAAEPLPPAEAAEDAATLDAIRSILTPQEAAPAARRFPATDSTEPSPEPAPEPPAIIQAVLWVTGTALGWGVTVVALPYGILRAGLAHMNGEDLRKISDDR